MASRSIYELKPLEEGQIRVLCLYPGDFDAPLRGHLDIVDLDEAKAGQPDLRLNPWSVTFGKDENIFDHWRNVYHSYFDIIEQQRTQSLQLAECIASIEKLSRERQALIHTLERTSPSLDAETSTQPFDGALRSEAWLAEAENWLREAKEISPRQVQNTWKNAMPSPTGHIMPPVGPQFDPFRTIISVLMIKTALKRNALVQEACTAVGYEAVSYAWGPPELTESIWIEGVDTELAITPALYDALRNLRFQDRNRRLWVDAVCINQSDVAERTRQVARMADVFSRAARVLVWLGPEEDGTESIAFSTVASCYIKRQFDLTYWEPYKCRLLCGNTIYCPCCGEAVAPYGSVRDVYAPVSQLSSKDWFRRLWVVQELAVAHYAEVVCGSHSMPWDAFVGTMDYIRALELQESLKPVLVAQSFYAMPYSPHHLLRMLVDMADRQCSDSRDRIFAIQNVVNSRSSRQSINASYLDSSEEIYRRVVVHCLQYAHSTGEHTEYRKWRSGTQMALPPISLIFALVGTESTRGNKLPSWVPNFDAMTRRSQMKAKEYTRRWESTADRMVHQVEESGLRLRVKGSAIGTIRSVLEASACVQDRPGIVDYQARFGVYQWFERCRDFAKCYWTPMDNFDFKFKELLLCIDRFINLGLYKRQMVGVASSFKLGASSQGSPSEILRILSEEVNTTIGKLSAEHFAKWTCKPLFEQSTADDLDLYDRGRNLSAIIGRGAIKHLGWIPQTAKHGDKVVAFTGAPQPFLLRPHTDGTFQLLGDCWIHGLCDLRSEVLIEDRDKWFTIA